MMSEADYRKFRAALRTLARPFILALEDRGIQFRISAGRVQAGPTRLLTELDRWTLQRHRAAVRTLITHRADWCAWPQPVPRFDPSTAFTSNTKDTERRTA